MIPDGKGWEWSDSLATRTVCKVSRWHILALKKTISIILEEQLANIMAIIIA